MEDAPNPGIRQGIHHDDTGKVDRQVVSVETPHMLNTTPKTLAILFHSPKFKEKLRTVEYVVEVDSLAANRRGTHLSVSLKGWIKRLAGRLIVVASLGRLYRSLAVYEPVMDSSVSVGRSTPWNISAGARIPGVFSI